MYSLYDLEVAASRLTCEFNEEKCKSCKCYLDIYEPSCVYAEILDIEQQLGSFINEISYNCDNITNSIINVSY